MTTLPNTITATVNTINETVDDGTSTEGTIDDLAHLLDLAEQLDDALSRLTGSIIESLIDRMETDTYPVAGVGLLTRDYRRSKKLRDADATGRYHEDLANAVASEVAINVGTGEVDPIHRNVARRAVQLVIEYASLGQPKATAKPALGVSVYDYWSETRTPTVKLRRGIEGDPS